MLTRGLLQETADLLERGMLDPASPAGRAIGYRQAIDFLFQEARLAAANGSTDDADIDVAGGGAAEAGPDPETRFLDFLLTFTAKTRQYSGEQMKWFRSSKGRDFSWQAWDLGGPIEEVRPGGGSKRGKTNNRAAVAAGRKISRAGDGCDWLGVVASIHEKFEMSREAFDEDLDGEYQASLRSENRERARDMKRYITALSLVDGSRDGRESLRSLVTETRGLAVRIRLAQPERFRNETETVVPAMEVQGWHAGTR